MLKAAKLVRKLKDEVVQCRVCEHYCVLQPEEWGRCGVRVNQAGTLYSQVYAESIATHVDPIEKKPLFHFLPGAKALSIGTYGCNMHCKWCQNWQISQTRSTTETKFLGERLTPQDLVTIAKERNIETIAYTYNEPTVFFEYSYDTAKLAHAAGIKNVYVSNGFMSQEALDAIAPYLDGINIDLKGFTEALYEDYTASRLEPVKRNIRTIAQNTDIWLEVTTLVIPDLNDSDAELSAAAAWLAAINPEIPWHVSAFHPAYQMRDRPRTSNATLERAYAIGKAAGLKFVYVGNIVDASRESTHCPACDELLIQRHGFHTRAKWTTPGICHKCGRAIPGVWRS